MIEIGKNKSQKVIQLNLYNENEKVAELSLIHI